MGLNQLKHNISFDELGSLAPQSITNYNSDDRPEREADRILTQGIVLRDHRGRSWGVSLLLPINIGITSFTLDGNFSLSSLSTLGIVPTGEFIIPINDRWTIQPFAWLGVAWTTDTGSGSRATFVTTRFCRGATVRWATGVTSKSRSSCGAASASRMGERASWEVCTSKGGISGIQWRSRYPASDFVLSPLKSPKGLFAI